MALSLSLSHLRSMTAEPSAQTAMRPMRCRRPGVASTTLKLKHGNIIINQYIFIINGCQRGRRRCARRAAGAGRCATPTKRAQKNKNLKKIQNEGAPNASGVSERFARTHTHTHAHTHTRSARNGRGADGDAPPAGGAELKTRNLHIIHATNAILYIYIRHDIFSH